MTREILSGQSRDLERERQDLLAVMEEVVEPDVMKMVQWAYSYEKEGEPFECSVTGGGTVDAQSNRG